MPKIEVTCALLKMPKGDYPQGSIVEASAAEVAQIIKDGNGIKAPADAVVTDVEPRWIDPLERAVRDADFEVAKGLAQSEGIKTPDPALDPKKPAPAERMPSGAVVEPIGRTKG